MKNSKMNNEQVIKCPKCGYEYLPCEIYMPDEFLGKAYQSKRNIKTGEIEWHTGTNMNTEEEFECCRCGCVFKVKANVEFETEILKENND